MSFFRKYGSVWHTLPGGEAILQNDITKFATIAKLYREDPRLHLTYRIEDGDRPETISHRLYDTVDYWWSVLILNGIYDMGRQWPKDQASLEAFIAEEYPLQNPKETLYYVDNDGAIASPLALKLTFGYENVAQAISLHDLKPVSIEQHEWNVNESKRQIMLVDPDKMSFLLKEMEDAFD